MKDLTVSDFVKGNRNAEFYFYRQKVLYYLIDYIGDDIRSGSIYSFPIPIEDVGEASLELKIKAITLMRWIRKAIEDKTLVKIKKGAGE